MVERLDPEALTTVAYDKADHVATVMLNRPEAMNSFNQAMCDEFAAIWAEVKADDDVHVVLLARRGTGRSAPGSMSSSGWRTWRTCGTARTRGRSSPRS